MLLGMWLVSDMSRIALTNRGFARVMSVLAVLVASILARANAGSRVVRG